MTEFCDGGNLWNAVRFERIKAMQFASRNFNIAQLESVISDDMPLLNIPSIAVDVCHALCYLHGAGFAHRDVKSSNILLTWCSDQNRICAKLCDFGSAAPVGKLPRRPAKPNWGGLERWLGFSGEWQPVGTVLWMAPEMLEPPVEGETPPDGYSGDKVDVYSLGVVLWELFEWRIPWLGGKSASKADIIDLVVRQNQRLPIPIRCSPRLTRLMVSMWNLSPLKRPTAAFVLSELVSIGSSWDTFGIFSHVQVAANMFGEELIGILRTSPHKSLTRNHESNEAISSSISSSQNDRGSTPREMFDEQMCDDQTFHSEDQQGNIAKHPKQSIAFTACRNSNMSSETFMDPGTEKLASNENRQSAQNESISRVEPMELVSSIEGAGRNVDHNIFGPVGTLSLHDIEDRLIPMLLPHIALATSSDLDDKETEDSRSKLTKLQNRVEKLRSRRKLDPFAAFSVDAQDLEISTLDRHIKLKVVKEQMRVWRHTYDILRNQMVQAESEYVSLQQKYNEILSGETGKKRF